MPSRTLQPQARKIFLACRAGESTEKGSIEQVVSWQLKFYFTVKCEDYAHFVMKIKLALFVFFRIVSSLITLNTLASAAGVWG